MRSFLLVASLLLGMAVPPGGANAQEEPPIDAAQGMARWNAANALCRNPRVPALEAIGACEQRDTYSKLLALARYCYGPAAPGGAPGWSSCTPAKAAQDAALARATARFERMGGVFVLPATLNATTRSYFIVDSGAANVQIPEEIVEELQRAGSLADSDYLGERRFVLADGRGVQQRIIRLRTLQIGDRVMENVLAAVGARRSRGLVGQSFLRRLNWWKIDNVSNAIELEFTGAF